ncbi:hypothetical protein FHS31_002603 [Sphingomonas vulcanisoli]|uniref:Uncharacterized protein n=1 Tax=Sphingomonas vulcanisoli TaxID=1658060 RepID=A0ABX0TVC7_9SPHN|nr:hypothetical protein [Sphingomonas vulcanisoli]NIJ08973.1 hypothetical protein [Sphingomonas vulcanisoli]
MTGDLQGLPIRRWGLHLLGLLALMWPPLVNGQPFFFSDTTAYVRAADLAVQIASRHHIRTAWSRPEAAPAPAGSAPAVGPIAAPQVHASDGQNGGSVMAGRSPYFGMLLYLGYVTSGFWLFVLGQAMTAWWLIGLAQRAMGSRSLAVRLGIAVILALLSPLAFYLGLLLADALAGFGILAFLLIARPPPDLRRWERPALMLLLLVSAAAHLTHIVIIAGMTALLGLLALVRAVPWRTAKPAVLIGGAVTVLALLSVMVTNFAVKRALGKPPAAAPVLTARFIVDGPGRAFIANGCGGDQQFAACTRPTAVPDSDLWLWSPDPKIGGFLAADADTRARLSAEDSRFARAVFTAYPLWQAGMMARNTLDQLTRFDLLILNEHCFADQGCSGVDFPDAGRATMRRTIAGRNLWPTRLLAALDAAATVAAIALLAISIRRLGRERDEARKTLLLWVALTAAAFLINAFLGGAISNPQTRYQERIVWIVPLLAMIAAIRAFRTSSEPARPRA